jgi:integrase
MGSLSTVSLAEARERAGALRLKRLDGVDPLEERRAARAKPTLRVVTFDEAASAFVAERESIWKSERHREQWYSSLRDFVSPVIGQMGVNQVETKHVTAVLDPMWSTKPVTASRVRGRIESILDWARVRGHRDGENPARWKGHLDHVYPAPGTAGQALRHQTGRPDHHAALPYSEISEFMANLMERTGSCARALEFTILTAARTGEVRGARWGEFDIDQAIWTVPGARMKGNRDHRVPLSPRAVEIIKEMAQIRRSDYVFPGDRPDTPLGRDTLYLMLQKLKSQHLTMHGFRSSFRDWAAEATNFPSEIAEAALAHALKSRVQAAYQRGDLLDKRRQLMEAWGSYCTMSQTDSKIASLIKQNL